MYCNVWLVAIVTPTSKFAQCPCSIQTLYCDNRSPSHYIIRFFRYVTRSILVLNGLKSRLLICASLLLTTNISGIFSIQFSSGACTKQKQYRHCSYEFMTKTSRLVGWEWGECALFVPSLVLDCHVFLECWLSESGNVTETIM